MKELLKKAFEAGYQKCNSEHPSMPDRPDFEEWYKENEKEVFSLHDVVGISEQLKSFADWLQSDTENLNYDFSSLVDNYLKTLQQVNKQ